MRTIGVIPSRWSSVRFPGKSLAMICGKPLVRWVVEASLRAESLDEVIVATDDERIADAVGNSGARVVMTSPGHPSGTDRVAEAADAGDDDIVVNIQGDEPLIAPELIDAVASKLAGDDFYDMSTACTPIRAAEDLLSPTVVKVVLDSNDGALYFSRLPIPFRRDGEQDLSSGLYMRHIGIYGYRGAFLKKMVAEPPCLLEQTESLEQLRAMWIGGRISVVRTEEVGVGVDRPEDVEIVERIMRERGLA